MALSLTRPYGGQGQLWSPIWTISLLAEISVKPQGCSSRSRPAPSSSVFTTSSVTAPGAATKPKTSRSIISWPNCRRQSSRARTLKRRCCDAHCRPGGPCWYFRCSATSTTVLASWSRFSRVISACPRRSIPTHCRSRYCRRCNSSVRPFACNRTCKRPTRSPTYSTGSWRSSIRSTRCCTVRPEVTQASRSLSGAVGDS